MAVLVLGMHRSGTSCVASMLAAARLADAGAAIRNWDNSRGHHERLELVRLNEAVLAHSGGHYLSAPAQVRWTDAHAAERDRLLAGAVNGRAALLKDPRTLLTLPFWRASTVPFRAVGVVRHPLAVARSLESWRAMPLAEGVALWTAHNRALLADRATHAYPIVDFDAPADDLVDALARAFDVEPRVLAAAHDGDLVHHDHADTPDVPGLAEAVALHAQLTQPRDAGRARYPRALLADVARALASMDRTAARTHARAALALVADRAAVLVPAVTLFVARKAYEDSADLIRENSPHLAPGLADLLLGKTLLASGDAETAVTHLARACAVAEPFHQARALLPHALRAVGRNDEARLALRALAADALYPHGPLSTLAEWSYLAGDRAAALVEMAEAIAAAPLHRRGRLRTRRAEWLIAASERQDARAELELAIGEDPGYGRSREILATL